MGTFVAPDYATELVNQEGTVYFWAREESCVELEIDLFYLGEGGGREDGISESWEIGGDGRFVKIWFFLFWFFIRGEEEGGLRLFYRNFLLLEGQLGCIFDLFLLTVDIDAHLLSSDAFLPEDSC